ncbi:hypothetical protein EJ03DRAFT_204970 [Teratosphaeria nubilosa]|uniref:SprT-like domain-containing protein n=1 Tax=Teratosphaeria nubilosa TaxID=161662 RepID=A0A6G1KYD1_9PEZI|nr:hypothetical protein EJ03DRAFT_204970 [Teratosphaeria nubilosa]
MIALAAVPSVPPVARGRRSLESIIETLLHEICHIYTLNFGCGCQRCSAFELACPVWPARLWQYLAFAIEQVAPGVLRLDRSLWLNRARSAQIEFVESGLEPSDRDIECLWGGVSPITLDCHVARMRKLAGSPYMEDETVD